jgi:hypothetical protein
LLSICILAFSRCEQDNAATELSEYDSDYDFSGPNYRESVVGKWQLVLQIDIPQNDTTKYSGTPVFLNFISNNVLIVLENHGYFKKGIYQYSYTKYTRNTKSWICDSLDPLNLTLKDYRKFDCKSNMAGDKLKINDLRSISYVYKLQK